VCLIVTLIVIPCFIITNNHIMFGPSRSSHALDDAEQLWDGHTLTHRGVNLSLFRLDCSSISDVSDLGTKWFQNKLAQPYTHISSPCSGRQGLRRCHDVHAHSTLGVQFRVCQWRFPSGPCEDMHPQYVSDRRKRYLSFSSHARHPPLLMVL
jgi:hypothetical protein